MKQVIQRLLICLILLSGGLSAQVTYTWIGGNGSWSVPSRWVPAGVPGAQDTARILSGTVTVNLNVTAAKVFLAASGLNGDSTLTVTDSLIWLAGSPSGNGSIDIASGAVLLIEGNLNRNFSRTINNSGTAIWRDNHDIQFVLGGTFNNLPGGVFEAQNDRRMHTDGGNGDGYFNNQGIFRKAAGSGTTEIGGAQGVTLNNDGLVEVLSGTLGLGSNFGIANSGGNFQIAAGTILRFIRGTHNLLAGSQVSGAGEVRFNGGTVNLAGQYDVALTRVAGGTANFNNTTPGAAVGDTLRLSSGNLGGSGQFDVNGPTFWSGGTLGTRFTTVGITNLNGGGVIGGAGEKQYGGGSNSIGGLMIWKDSGNINVSTGGNLTIQAGATLEIVNDQQIYRSNGGINITNYGTIRKTASFGYTYIGRVFGSFNNHGLVEVESGYLNINGAGGGNDDGAYVVAPFATLWFSGGTQNLSGSATISGGGDLLVSGGTVNHAGGYTLTGRTRVTGGTLNFNNTVAREAVAQNVFLSGGNLGSSGRLDVDGNFDWSGGVLGTPFTNIGIINLNAGGQIRGNNDKQHGGGTTNNYGVLVWSDSGGVNISTGGTFNNQAGALFDIRNDQSFFRTNGGLNFNNDGLIRKSAGSGTSLFDATFGNFINNGTIDVQTGTLRMAGFGGVHNNGECIIGAGTQLRIGTNQNFLNDGSEIRGDGALVLESSVSHTNNGGYGPGVMAGILTVSGPFSPGAQADVNIEIGGHAPGTEYDRLVIPGSATLNGALNVSFINSFQPAAGDTFTVLSAGTLNGQFAQVNAPPGVTVQASYPGNNRVVVTVSDVTNTPPLTGDEILVTNEDEPGAVNVLLNDSDPQGDPLSIAQIFQPQYGMVTQQGDSVLAYSPYPNYFGPDTFYY